MMVQSECVQILGVNTVLIKSESIERSKNIYLIPDSYLELWLVIFIIIIIITITIILSGLQLE